MATPAVTAFITFHEPSAHLAEAIESVLAQTFTDFELLLVCDGDRDRTQEFLDRYPDPRIRLVFEDFGGGPRPPQPLPLIRSRNRGLREAHAPLVMLLDADDVAEPERLAAQVEFLHAHPEHVLVGSAIVIIDEQSRPIGTRRHPSEDALLRKRMLELNCLAQSSLLLRRDAAIAAGGYLEEINYAEDYDLWLRMMRLGKIHNLEAPLTRYRIHSSQAKARLTRLQFRDTLRLKLRAVRRYGHRPTARATIVFLLQVALFALPSRLVYWLFQRLFFVKAFARRS